MEWIEVGSFLGHPIRLASVRTLPSSLSEEGLDSTLLMIAVRESAAFRAENLGALETVLEAEPLAVMYWGCHAQAAFDHTLEIQAKGAQRRHSMTKLSTAMDLGAALQEFFFATWPSEDRFAAWETYSILAIESEDSRNEVASLVLAIADPQQPSRVATGTSS